MIRRAHRLLPVLGLVLVAGLLVWRAATLLRYDLWYDELYSLYAASGDFGQVWGAALADRVHPPLFYFVLWGWLQPLEPTPGALRLLPLVVYAMALGATWWAAAGARVPPPARVLTVLLVGVNPIVFDAGADLRGYSLLVLWVALLIGAMLRLLTKPADTGQRAVLLAAGIAAVWTHYFAWPTIAAIVTILWYEGHRKLAGWLGATTVLSVVPWALALRASPAEAALSSQIGWADSPGAVEWLLLPGNLLAARAPAVVIAGLAIGGWLLFANVIRQQPARRWLLLAAAPPLTALLGSLLLGVTIWDARYFIGCILPLALLLTHWAIRGGEWRAIAAALVVGVSSWSASIPAEWRIPWGSITRTIASSGTEQSVRAFDGFTALPLRYYSTIEGLGLTVPEVKTWPAPGDRQGWIVLRPSMFPDGPPAGDRLRQAGFVVVDSLLDGEGANRVEVWRYR